jgi:hypothetical protein
VRYTAQSQDLATETRRLQQVLEQPTFPFCYLEELQTAPAKPQNGMVAFGAAGVLGVARGVYVYYGAAWNFMG